MTSTTCEGAHEEVVRPRLKDVLQRVKRIECRTDSGGAWNHEPNEFIWDLVTNQQSMDGTRLQAELLDWIESEDRNKFLNLTTGETIYALSAKRGNKVYATRKIKKRGQIKTALDGKEFEILVDGFRNRRWTRLLLTTTNFDRA